MARKEKKYHFIYKTTNITTGRYYYGMHSTNNLDDGYLGSGRRLRYSINKYGKDAHQREIIEFCPDRSSLKETEMKIVTLDEVAKKDCMNLMIGGEGGFISEEQQRHRSVSANKKFQEKRNDNPEFNDSWLNRKKESMVLRVSKGIHNNWKDNYSWSGKCHTEETKKLMSIKASERVGEKNSQFGTYWITKNGNNKKIKKTDLQKHIIDGWMRGRVFNN